jgi:uncharacterized protein YcfJ
VNLQIRLGVAGRNAAPGEIGRNDVVRPLSPIMQADSKVGGYLVGAVGSVSGQQIGGLGGVRAEIVEFAFWSRRGDQLCHGLSGRAFLDVPR